MKLADRMSRISVSGTMLVSEKVIQLREQGVDIVDFGAGEPDFPTPENIKQAGILAIQGNFTRYTAIGGIKELRAAIVDQHARDFGSRYDISECIVNVGGKHSIFNLCSALVDEGDDILIPTPYWVSFGDIAHYVGARTIFVPTRADEGFRLTAAMVERAITPKSRMLIVNSPCNPSGAVIDDEEFVRIAALCRKNDIWLLSDECYSKFLYEGRKPFSIASYPEFRSHVVIAGSLSKTYAMTGWRIGYVLGPREVVSAVQKLQSHSTSNPTSISQKAALEAVTGPQDSVQQMLAEYARRRAFVNQRLRAINGVMHLDPAGAFYVFPDITSLLGPGVESSMDFALQRLEKAHVAVVPGEAFGAGGHIRISYATSMELLDTGLTRIARFMESLRH
jgi:aspartate aminotransferase